MTLKSEGEIIGLLSMTTKQKERELGIKMRNGQALEGIKAMCRWMIK